MGPGIRKDQSPEGDWKVILKRAAAGITGAGFEEVVASGRPVSGVLWISRAANSDPWSEKGEAERILSLGRVYDGRIDLIEGNKQHILEQLHQAERDGASAQELVDIHYGLTSFLRALIWKAAQSLILVHPVWTRKRFGDIPVAPETEPLLFWFLRERLRALEMSFLARTLESNFVPASSVFVAAIDILASTRDELHVLAEEGKDVDPG